MVTAIESGATVPTLEIVKAQASWSMPDEVVKVAAEGLRRHLSHAMGGSIPGRSLSR
jgi:hypothetical protein